MPCVRSFWKKSEKNEKNKNEKSEENEINDKHRSCMDGAYLERAGFDDSAL